MKVLPPGLQAHLSSGATILCWCWRLTRRSGERYGFTDHDRDISFDGTVFEAAAGFTASELRTSVGLAVDDLEIESALVSTHLTEAALAAGDFDDAAVEIFRVNWQTPDQRVLMRLGSLGEVRRSGSAFTAEIRGLAHYLQQPNGRIFQHSCDADLGDPRCGVDLQDPDFRGVATIAEIQGDRLLRLDGLTSYSDGWFTHGLMSVTTGSNAGRRMEIKRHMAADGFVRVELWQQLGAAFAIGDQVVVTAGCDKQLATCRDRFQNTEAFRGFPHMPGNDFLSSPPHSG